MHIDFGTGDGLFAYRFAKANPERFVLGLDANTTALREISARAAAKPAKGGLPNAMFGRLALADAPGELTGLAGSLTVMLPWGSLLTALALPTAEGLAGLRALLAEGGSFTAVFGYSEAADTLLNLPALSECRLRALEALYRAAGFAVKAELLGAEEVRAIPSTWAKKLAYSGKPRPFVKVQGAAI